MCAFLALLLIDYTLHYCAYFVYFNFFVKYLCGAVGKCLSVILMAVSSISTQGIFQFGRKAEDGVLKH